MTTRMKYYHYLIIALQVATMSELQLLSGSFEMSLIELFMSLFLLGFAFFVYLKDQKYARTKV